MLIKHQGRWYLVSAKVAVSSILLLGSAFLLIIGLALILRDQGELGAALFIGALVGLPLIALVAIFFIAVRDQLKNPQQFVDAAEEMSEQAKQLKRLQGLR